MALVKEWLSASIDDLKERAMTIDPADLRGLQGEVKAHKRLFRALTEKPLHVDE